MRQETIEKLIDTAKQASTLIIALEQLAKESSPLVKHLNEAVGMR